MTSIDNDQNVHLNKFQIPDLFLANISLGFCENLAPTICSMAKGRIADVNIWSRELSRPEMEEWTSCQSRMEGDLLAWTNSSWELENAWEVYGPLIRCASQERLRFDVAFPKRVKMLEGLMTCWKFGGEMLGLDYDIESTKRKFEFYQICEHPKNPLDSEC